MVRTSSNPFTNRLDVRCWLVPVVHTNSSVHNCSGKNAQENSLGVEVEGWDYKFRVGVQSQAFLKLVLEPGPKSHVCRNTPPGGGGSLTSEPLTTFGEQRGWQIFKGLSSV